MRRQGLWGLKTSKIYSFWLGSLSFVLDNKVTKQYKNNPPKTSESLSIHSNCLRGSFVYYVLFSYAVSGKQFAVIIIPALTENPFILNTQNTLLRQPYNRYKTEFFQ